MAVQFPTTGTMQGDIAAGLIKDGVYNPNIDVSKINPTNPIKLPDPSLTPDYNATLAGTNVSLPPTPEETAVKTTQDKITADTTALGGQSAYQLDQEKALGLDENKKTLNNLQAELNSVNTEAQVSALNLDRQGTATRLTAANTLDRQNIEKDRTIKALRISASIQAIQGNIALANDQVTKAVALKYDPLKAEIETLNKQLEYNYKSFDNAEKKKADALKAANDLKLKALDIEKDATENWLKTKNEALSNSAPLKIVQQAEALKSAGKENDARALLAPYTGPKTSTSDSTAATLKNDSKKIGTFLSGRTGTDGYVGPEDYKKARSAWIADGYSTADFDNKFGGFVNPSRAQDYGIKWKPSALTANEQLLQTILTQGTPAQ